MFTAFEKACEQAITSSVLGTVAVEIFGSREGAVRSSAICSKLEFCLLVKRS
jgi:hypothetical protein